jgi:toxin ParE1/3/4
MTPKQYEVRLTMEAELDVDDIFNYIAEHDSPEQAVHVFHKLQTAFERLMTFPDGGGYLPELLQLSNYNYRQIFFGPYRIIYRIEEDSVKISAVVDGRRDLLAFLKKRLNI